VIQGLLKEKFFSISANILRGWVFLPLALERAPQAPKPVVIVVAFSSFIHQHDIIQTVIFLSSIHHTCIFTYIIHIYSSTYITGYALAD